MQILSSSIFLTKVLNKPNFSDFRRILIIAFLLFVSTGCSQVSSLQKLPSLLPNLSSDSQFQIQVKPSGRPGVYTVLGNTNLPEESRITVAAIRYLQPHKQRIQNLSPSQTFSILAYQDIKVNKGKWQATLNLWKVSPKGEFQEVWQLEQSQLGISHEAQPEVTFLATVSPRDSLSELEQQLQKQGVKLVSRLVRNTVDGERYIQTSQVLPISLPTGQTTPPQPAPEDINGGWGNRFLLIPEPPNINNYKKPEQRRTNAPLSPDELLQ